MMNTPSLVVIFLRGGCDGLSMISPSGDSDYVAARPGDLRVMRDGDTAGTVLRNANADVDFRFHHDAKDLAELFHANELAVFHAAGLKDATRSHFDAEDRMERAAPNVGASVGGWLARWLNEAKPDGILTSLAVGSSAPDSLRGALGVAVAGEIQNLRLVPGSGHSVALRTHFGRMLGSDPVLAAPLKRLLTLSEAIETKAALDSNGNLKPYEPAAAYPKDNPLAEQLKTVAQAIKLELGLRISTVDFGGWDTHVNQKYEIGRQIGHLSGALMAFWKDLGNRRDDVSVVVMSEFGRRLKSNESGGTDHGHGNVMFALGAKVKGGRMYGEWPGLHNDVLDEGADLAITTDYRTVLAEMVSSHMNFADVQKVFPGFDGTMVGYIG
jgi:uncharacterized protein (DUF1501 family)